MDHPDVEVIETRTPYRSFLTVSVLRLRHRLFGGGWSVELKREVCDRGHAAGILLYDPDRDAVVLIQQFRAGAAAAGGDPWLTEVVAGMIGAGETAEDVARREALEEAACTVREIVPVCTFYPSPGALTEHLSLFCGRVDSAGLPETAGLAEEHEDIRILVMPADEAIRLLDEDKLNNSITVIAVGWLARHRDRLRADWTGSGA